MHFLDTGDESVIDIDRKFMNSSPHFCNFSERNITDSTIHFNNIVRVIATKR